MRPVSVAVWWMCLLAALVLGMGCGGSQTGGSQSASTSPPPEQPGVQVSAIEIGHGADADRHVVHATAGFAPKDTIYASVLTTGIGSDVELKARWTYQDGQLVNESSQMISPTGSSATEFHISNPEGWPKGSYKLEIHMNGNLAGTKSFTVQ